MFPEAFVHTLIWIGLIWTAAGAISLIVLLIRDFRQGNLW